jgi:hypothetical protein
MSVIDAELQVFLPPKRKQTPSGWISFNAVCCHHNGEKPDTRKRGGILMNPTGGFQYHCFNCGFKAGWTKGKLLSKNTKMLFGWLGMPETLISELTIDALREQESIPTVRKTVDLTLQERSLPEDSKSFDEWAKENCTDPDFVNAVTYVLDRGFNLDWYNWMWTPAPGYKDRVLIPFYNEGKIVGYTGRKIKDGKPKYLTDGQGTYVFNIDRQTHDREFVLVVEGQFDAIAVDGVAIMTNEPNEAQVTRIAQLQKEVIVVPDRDKPGAKLIKAALENNWNVSLPDWGDDVKDCAEAVRKYGRLYTLLTIVKYKETNRLKIELLKKELERLDD